MIELSVLYFITGILWIMATRHFWYTETIKWPMLLTIILINILLWPIAMMELAVDGPPK